MQYTATGNWRIYPLTVGDQQQHIDQSERLLSTIQAGDAPILYWSQAQPQGVVLGFSQNHTILRQAQVQTGPLPIYRRRAGGTAVHVGPHLLSLDVVLPMGHSLILADIVESYRWLGEAWVAALLLLGIQARVVPPTEAHAQQSLLKKAETREYEAVLRRACYGSLSPYEVVVGQRKVIGLDMIRRRVGSLLQAGVLLQWQPETLVRLLGQTQQEQAQLCEGLSERATGLDIIAGRTIAADEVVAAFTHIITTNFD
ncbi:MAG: hypothetical protein JO183_04745 [Ktedonobacteraceae bacterium]|nr:hypothetical protein [Ktedonobacteraceae bacterium]